MRPLKTATPPPAADLRERVLAAAFELVEKEGLAALSMREVARRAGVSHQAPYHHFKGREEILAAMAQEGFGMLEQRLAEARRGAESPREAAERAGEAYILFAVRHPAHFRLMFRPELVDVEAHREVMDCGQRAFAHVPQIVRALVEDGLPAEPNEQALVALTWAAVHGLACLLLDGPLAHTLPDLGNNPERGVRDVMRALGGLLAHASAGRRRRAKRRG